ncbi:hypothetical protein Peur_051304 [Populus x canadensis]
MIVIKREKRGEWEKRKKQKEKGGETDIVEELAWKLLNVTFLKVDVDELKSVAQEWDVQAMPTFIFLKDGEIVEKFTGVNKMKLQSTVEKACY